MKTNVQPEIISFGSASIIKNLQNLNRAIQRVRQRKNIEDIHDLRVASRRVRTALSIFAPYLPAKKIKIWENSIRKLTKVFSKARDLDVQFCFVKSITKQQINPQTRPGIRRLLIRLKKQQARYYPRRP